MPRKMNPTFVPSSQPASAGVSLDDIPQEIRDEVEEMYAALQKADGRFQIEFDTKQEVAEYEKLVKSYCALRFANGVPAPIRYRRSPAKGMGDTTIQFRIVDIPAEKEAATEAIKDATAKVNATAEPVDMTQDAPAPTPVKAAGRKR